MPTVPKSLTRFASSQTCAAASPQRMVGRPSGVNSASVTGWRFDILTRDQLLPSIRRSAPSGHTTGQAREQIASIVLGSTAESRSKGFVKAYGCFCFLGIIISECHETSNLFSSNI